MGKQSVAMIDGTRRHEISRCLDRVDPNSSGASRQRMTGRTRCRKASSLLRVGLILVYGFILLFVKPTLGFPTPTRRICHQSTVPYLRTPTTPNTDTTAIQASTNTNENKAKESESLPLSGDRKDDSSSIRANLGPLFALTRPKNFPGVVLFHMTGVYLALTSLSTSSGNPSYWALLLKRPALWLTLIALLLVDSTSMVVNDYYDAKLGRDKSRNDRVLVAGRVSFATTKRFVSYLYAVALLLVCFVPGAVTRLSVISGLILTYLYTQYMKPVTWLKNVVCASLIALSPWSSGSAALHVVLQVDQARWSQLAIPPLWRLVGALFCGVTGREILMDCKDVETDREGGVRTVPVVHGRRYASRVAFVGTCSMTLLAMVGPVEQLCRGSVPGAVVVRRLVLGGVACAISLFHGWRVVQTEAKDTDLVKRTVDEGLLTVLLLLASFL